MSTTTPSPRLSARLVDDAAVFPPARTPVDRAWRAHVSRRDQPWGEHVGPLLVAPVHAELLATVARAHPADRPVDTVLVARAGTVLADVDEAMATLEPVACVRMVGVEVTHGEHWRDALPWQLPLAVEVDPDPRLRDAALDDLARARAQGHPVVAKLRTQSTPERPLPGAVALAGFLVACASRDLTFKLTGGLHHGVAGTVDLGDGLHEWQHGVVNVLAATRAAQAGEPRDRVAALLERSDAEPLCHELRALTTEEAEQLRQQFTSFGCCDVTDPLHDLTRLGLVAPAPTVQEEPV
ncbi:hypothetical protein [Ornithinimicrobium sediminis]|uniref:hypothetical protein n=1 Tax=Ornithinimicrobium sediminis TaxID=2904603 RepID=UPI001E575BCC|nr:hypothetical protein [Ornithinimicrobium sediminis]MCE0486588.1 hypothetical protein [Ornithinimicrobium sediminis]